MSTNEINLILYTDLGDDIDDTLALWFTNKATAIKSMIVILSSHNSTRRQQTRNEVAQYLTTSYTMIVGDSASCDSKLQNQIQAGIEYTILCIGPTTECARHMQQQIIPYKQIQSLTIQAGITPNNNTADSGRTLHQESRNLKTDLQAAQFFDSSFLEYNIPINWIGKYAAYEIGLSKNRFTQLALQEKEFGTYIEQQAHHWQMIFSQKNPQKYHEIYGSHPDILSFPYDLIALLTILYPHAFYWEEYKYYSTIGHTSGKRISKKIYTLLGVDNKE